MHFYAFLSSNYWIISDHQVYSKLISTNFARILRAMEEKNVEAESVVNSNYNGTNLC